MHAPAPRFLPCAVSVLAVSAALGCSAAGDGGGNAQRDGNNGGDDAATVMSMDGSTIIPLDPDAGVVTDAGTVYMTDAGTILVTDTGTYQVTDDGTVAIDIGVPPTKDSGGGPPDIGIPETGKMDTAPPLDAGRREAGMPPSDAVSSSDADSSSNACTASGTQSGGTQYCSNSQGNASNGYSYQLWSNGIGSGCMTIFGNDTFKANWSGAGDFLARVGLGFNSNKTPAQIGTISADFAETKMGNGGGFSFVGIYGWSVSPLHEYYIVEDWFGSRPGTGGGTTNLGTITVDGGTYDVLSHPQKMQPSIMGTADFVQFFSIRQTPRQCGHISISEHFSKWAGLGLQLGNMEEARILVEVGNNATGSINFTAATVQVN